MEAALRMWEVASHLFVADSAVLTVTKAGLVAEAVLKEGVVVEVVEVTLVVVVVIILPGPPAVVEVPSA